MSEQVILHLSLIDGIGPSAIQHLVTHKPAHYSWADLYNFSLSDWKTVFGSSDKTSTTLMQGLADRALLEAELRLIEKHRAQWITIISDEYPTLLRNIHYPPSVIWWQGSSCWKDTDQLLAIVGSRKANFYGQDVINTFVPTLVSNGWTIVSGGALGADGMAHSATLKAGGKTVVVLGSGLAHKYPQSHGRLFDTVLSSGGSILSIFPIDTPAYPTNFPIRNRVVSGLSKGCLVVQAAVKSGARITAQHALEQGRDVFAVPGSIKDDLSGGCHALIQQGAKLVTTVEDILSEYQYARNSCEQGAQQSILSVQETIGTLTPEGKILAACAQPLSIDDLIEVTGIELLELQTLLCSLQLDGKIRQDFSGLWTKV
jgi:DNA processing protein